MILFIYNNDDVRQDTNLGLLALQSAVIPASSLTLTSTPSVSTMLHTLHTMALNVGDMSTESPNLNIFLERQGWIVSYFPYLSDRLEADKQVLIMENRPLSILAVLVAHTNITIKLTAGLNLKIAASSQQECRWISLALNLAKMKWKISTSIASSSAGYQHVFKSLDLIHG